MTERSVKIAVVTLRKFFEDVEASLVDSGTDRITAQMEAATQAMQALPLLDSVQGVREYIGCISWLQGRSLIEPAEIRSHMYTAQVALQALNTGTKPQIAVPRKAVKVASIKRKSQALRKL